MEEPNKIFGMNTRISNKIYNFPGYGYICLKKILVQILS